MDGGGGRAHLFIFFSCEDIIACKGSLHGSFVILDSGGFIDQTGETLQHTIVALLDGACLDEGVILGRDL